jgi:polysaccharide pyruvyl transferase WcaK-like protein
MLVEVRKAGFTNKGAELMLHAVLDKMKAEYPGAKFAVAPHPIAAPYEERIKLGLYQKPDIWKYGVQWGKIFEFVPNFIRNMYGIVLDKEVDVVIDAAGFAYSDQQGKNASLGLAKACKRWKKGGTKTVLMPQAFGPFNDPVIRASIKVALDNADLIFAREKTSYSYLIDIVGERKNLMIAPDYTNLIEGVLPNYFDTSKNKFCLIPNSRMIDKTDTAQKEAYLPFMVYCAKYLIKKGVKPFLLIHGEDQDLNLAEEINKATGGVLPIIQEAHPLKIKGIIGACEGVVGSRFHGLVSALCQGVPALGTGWSHKYQALFDDYGFSEGLLDVRCSEKELYDKLEIIVNQETKSMVKKKIEQESILLKQQSEAMWDDVFEVLNRK